MKTYEQFNQEEPEVKREFYENGQKKSELWILNGKEHREDGPTYQGWYKNGQKNLEEWWLNNELYREDGPAFQRWYENGQKQSEHWYLNGIRYSREEWIDKLKEIGSSHYKEQKMLYDMEKYNL